MAVTKRISLINQLVRLVVLPILIISAVLSGLQVYLHHQTDTYQKKHLLEEHVELILHPLAKALYDADAEAIEIIGNSLFRNQNVNSLLIADQFSTAYQRTRIQGQSSILPGIEISRPLTFKNHYGQQLLLGNIHIHYGANVLTTASSSYSTLIAVIEAMKILLPLGLFIFFLRQKFQKRISTLITEISTTRPEQQHKISQLKNDPKEVQELVSAYNQLQEKNYRYHSQQQEAHNQLIQKNHEVAEGRESARLLTSMLQNSQKRYRALFHRNIDALLIVESYRLDNEEHFRIIDANQSAMDILDQPLEQLIKQDFEVMFGSRPLEHGYVLLNESDLPEALLSAGIHIELHFNMVMYDKQSLYYITLKDVSDKIRAQTLEKEAEELMNFRQNQMALSEMATTIAHEINQPLAAIQNYALSAINFSNAENLHRDKLHHSLNQLMQQADMAAQIVQQARGHLGRNDYPQKKLNLVTTLQESVELCRLRAEKSGVKVSLVTDLDEAIIIGNEVQIKQVMINLLTNSIEALTELKDIKRAACVYLEGQDKYFQIRVCDNGHGIQNIDRIFTTHYTTKEKGLGMGLAICRSIAEMHYGSISARNQDQGGAEFTLVFPVQVPTANKKSAAHSEQQPN